MPNTAHSVNWRKTNSRLQKCQVCWCRWDDRPALHKNGS